MLVFLGHYWDKVLVAIVSVYGAVLSTYTFLQSRKRDHRELEERKKESDTDIAAALWEMRELSRSVAFLDEWIFEKSIFTRKTEILDALARIKTYWKQHEDTLRTTLGKDSRIYIALRGLYDIALQNEANQPPPDGRGQWRGITQENLLGYTISTLVDEAARELERRRT